MTIPLNRMDDAKAALKRLPPGLSAGARRHVALDLSGPSAKLAIELVGEQKTPAGVPILRCHEDPTPDDDRPESVEDMLGTVRCLLSEGRVARALYVAARLKAAVDTLNVELSELNAAGGVEP